MTGEQKPGGLEVARYGSETAEQIIRRWAGWINDVSADMEEPEWGGKSHNDVLNERDFLIKALTQAEPAEARIRELEARVAHLTQGCAKQNNEVCRVLGRALGYPAFVDDQVNFPGTTEADGVCVGEHVAESLADEAARRITTTQAQLAKAKEALERIKDMRPTTGLAHDMAEIASDTLAALQEAGEVGS